MSTMADDPKVHAIRGGRFVCTADADAGCRNYPGCACERFDEELHGNPPAPGHEPRPQAECLIAPWIEAGQLFESYSDGFHELLLDDDEFPDGPVTVTWEVDYLTWQYADDTRPPGASDDE